MGDLHDGRPLGVELREQLHDLAALAGVQVAGRLVGQNQLRLGDQGARHPDELLLAPRQLARVEVFLAHDLEPVEGVGHEALPFGPGHVAVRQRHVEVLGDGEVVEQVVALEDEPDVGAAERLPVLGPQAVDGLAEEVVLAGPRRVVHPQNVEQGRLAGAGRPHDGDELARGDVEGDAAQDERAADAVAEALFDVAQGEQGFGHGHYGSRSPTAIVRAGRASGASVSPGRRTTTVRYPVADGSRCTSTRASGSAMIQYSGMPWRA